MANPRQRRKSRSSSFKPVSHSRHAKRNLRKTPTIRGPKVLQDAWDRHKTVKQNYAALGLLHTLNPSSSGGVEPVEIDSTRDETQPEVVSLKFHKNAPIPKGFGRITRDETGQVVHIEMHEEECQPDAARDMETLGPEVDDAVLEKWTMNLAASRTAGAGPVGIVQALEGISGPANHRSNTLSLGLSGAGPRHSSAGEISYLKRLVSVHGVDTERMARDRKLNTEQRTAGELKRALRRARLDE